MRSSPPPSRPAHALAGRARGRAALVPLLATLLCGACGGAPGPRAPTAAGASVAIGLDPAGAAAERLMRRRSLADLAAMPLEAREEAVFGALYNELDHPKPRSIAQDELTARLGARAERAHDEGPWHVRWGVEGTADLSADTVRFYFDVLCAEAATLADELTLDLDRRGLRRYSFKVLREVENFDIPVAAVLYVEGADAEAGRAASLAFAAAHADALWPEEPPFTERLAPGLARADELGDHGPPGVAGRSFGGAMAHLVAQALEGAPASLDAEALGARIRAALRSAGFDPEAPWHRPAR